MAEGRRDSLTGSGVTRGIAIGRAHLLARSELDVRQFTIERRDVVHEIGRLTTGFNAVRNELDHLKSNIAAGAPSEVAAFLDLHRMILDDALLAGLAYLIVNEDRELQRDALNRDVDTLVQSISLRLETMSEAATKIAQNVADADYNDRRFTSATRELMLQKQELMHMAFVDAQQRVRWSVASPGPPRVMV